MKYNEEKERASEEGDGGSSSGGNKPVYSGKGRRSTKISGDALVAKMKSGVIK
jgi:hypothetical protein